MGWFRFLLLPLATFVPAAAQVDVVTANYDKDRTNANLHETILTVSNVKVARFGKAFSLPVDGFIYAQPLYVRNLTIPGKGVHNVVFVATMHNSVYAFDADTPQAPLWTVTLGPPVLSSDYELEDIVPEVGILSTPVIDLNSGTIYVVANNIENGLYFFRLHALDITTGEEMFGGPAEISASVPGQGQGSQDGMVSFVPFDHLQRPGLLLLNNVVYASFGSHQDRPPYHGWLIGYDARNLQRQAAVFNVTPDGEEGSIWQSGRAPAADDLGNIYITTADGDHNGATNWGESILRLGAAGGLTVADWFTPDNWMDLNLHDDDLGSCGPVLIPGTNLLVSGSKRGAVFVLDRNNLGHLSTGNSGALQSFQAVNFGLFNSVALWNNADGPILYIRGQDQFLTAFRMSGGLFNPTPMSESMTDGPVSHDGVAVSANGSTAGTGIVWNTRPIDYSHPTSGILYAYDALDLRHELWNSELNPARDRLGLFAKFATPTIAGGKVFVPTFSKELAVYGLLTSLRQIKGIVNGASMASGPVSPGEIVTIYGAGFGPASPAGARLDSSGRLTTSLAGVRVLFDGAPAPMLFAWRGQLRVVVPYSVSGRGSTRVQIDDGGQLSGVFPAPVAGCAPGLFTTGVTGVGQGAILNEDFTVNSEENPAARGSIVMLYGTGEGITDPPAVDGKSAGFPLHVPVAPVSVSLGGEDAAVTYAGAAPGLVSGVIQVNVRVPEGIEPGPTVPVLLKVGDAASQPGVTLAVR